MSNAITLPKSVFNDLINRINMLEMAVFGGKSRELPAENITLTHRAKNRYVKMKEDSKKGKNFYSFDNPDKALDFLLSDKR